MDILQAVYQLPVENEINYLTQKSMYETMI